MIQTALVQPRFAQKIMKDELYLKKSNNKEIVDLLIKNSAPLNEKKILSHQTRQPQRDLLSEIFEALDGSGRARSQKLIAQAENQARAMLVEAEQILAQAKTKAVAMVEEANVIKMQAEERAQTLLKDAKASVAQMDDTSRQIMEEAEAYAHKTTQEADAYAEEVRSDADRYAESVLQNVYQQRKQASEVSDVLSGDALQSKTDWSIIDIID